MVEDQCRAGVTAARPSAGRISGQDLSMPSAAGMTGTPTCPRSKISRGPVGGLAPPGPVKVQVRPPRPRPQTTCDLRGSDHRPDQAGQLNDEGAALAWAGFTCSVGGFPPAP